MIKYLIKKWYYIPISLITFLVYTYGFKIELTILETLLIILLTRFFDDFFDYNEDKGKRISKKNSITLIIISTILYLTINIVTYKLRGTLSLLIILYLILMNKFETLKLFLLTLVTLYYYLLNNNTNYYVLIITLIISILYSIIKRWKHDIQK